MSKLIFAASQAVLESSLSTIQSLNPAENPSYRSIAITDDGYFYTHGRKFRLYRVTSSGVQGLGLEWDSQDGKLNLTDGQTIVDQIDAVHTISGDSIITATRGTNNHGLYTITHAQPQNLVTNTTYGSNSALNTVNIPSITIDSYGHITAISNITVDATKVKASVIGDSDNNHYSIIGVNGDSIQSPKYYTNTYIDKDGNIYEGNTALVNKYAAKAFATNEITGTVVLSDSIESDSNAATGHTAATPYAVKQALISSKNYADGLFSKNDALILVGTIDHNGLFKSHNSTLFPSIQDDTTYVSTLDYKAGYTFKFTDSGVITLGDSGYQLSFTVEPGDVLLCVNDKPSGIYRGSDFTVIQNNIEGGLVSSNALTGVLYGTGTRSVSALANPQSTKYLRYTVVQETGTLEWVDASAGWRTFYQGSVSGSTIQNKNIIMAAATGNSADNPLVISFDTSGTNAIITYTINPKAIVKSAASKLTLKQGNNTTFEYDTSAAKTLNIDPTLTLSESDSIWTLGHASSGISQDTVAKVRKTKVDSYGHITYYEEVTGLKNPNPLYTAVNGTAVALSYDGDAKFGYNFKGGTDVTITSDVKNTTNGFAYETGNNTAGIDLTFSITHKYRPVSILKSDNTTVDVLSNATANTLVLKEGDHVTLTKDQSDNLVIASSWRPVSVYALSNGTPTVASLDSSSSLVFSNDFLVDNGELAIYWTEIDSSGNITYVK